MAVRGNFYLILLVAFGVVALIHHSIALDTANDDDDDDDVATESPKQPIGAGDPSLQHPMGMQMSYQQPIGAQVPYQQPMGSQMAYQQPMGSQMAYQQPMGAQMAYQQPMGAQVAYQQPTGAQMAYPQPMGAQINSQTGAQVQPNSAYPSGMPQYPMAYPMPGMQQVYPMYYPGMYPTNMNMTAAAGQPPMYYPPVMQPYQPYPQMPSSTNQGQVQPASSNQNEKYAPAVMPGMAVVDPAMPQSGAGTNEKYPAMPPSMMPGMNEKYPLPPPPMQVGGVALSVDPNMNQPLVQTSEHCLEPIQRAKSCCNRNKTLIPNEEYEKCKEIKEDGTKHPLASAYGIGNVCSLECVFKNQKMLVNDKLDESVVVSYLTDNAEDAFKSVIKEAASTCIAKLTHTTLSQTIVNSCNILPDLFLTCVERAIIVNCPSEILSKTAPSSASIASSHDMEKQMLLSMCPSLRERVSSCNPLSLDIQHTGGWAPAGPLGNGPPPPVMAPPLPSSSGDPKIVGVQQVLLPGGIHPITGARQVFPCINALRQADDCCNSPKSLIPTEDFSKCEENKYMGKSAPAPLDNGIGNVCQMDCFFRKQNLLVEGRIVEEEAVKYFTNRVDDSWKSLVKDAVLACSNNLTVKALRHASTSVCNIGPDLFMTCVQRAIDLNCPKDQQREKKVPSTPMPLPDDPKMREIMEKMMKQTTRTCSMVLEQVHTCDPMTIDFYHAAIISPQSNTPVAPPLSPGMFPPGMFPPGVAMPPGAMPPGMVPPPSMDKPQPITGCMDMIRNTRSCCPQVPNLLSEEAFRACDTTGQGVPPLPGLEQVCQIECVFKNQSFVTSNDTLDLNVLSEKMVASVNDTWKPIVKDACLFCHGNISKMNGDAPPRRVIGRCSIDPEQFMNCVQRHLILNCPKNDAPQSTIEGSTEEECPKRMERLRECNPLEIPTFIAGLVMRGPALPYPPPPPPPTYLGTRIDSKDQTNSTVKQVKDKDGKVIVINSPGHSSGGGSGLLGPLTGFAAGMMLGNVLGNKNSPSAPSVGGGGYPMQGPMGGGYPGQQGGYPGGYPQQPMGAGYPQQSMGGAPPPYSPYGQPPAYGQQPGGAYGQNSAPGAYGQNPGGQNAAPGQAAASAQRAPSMQNSPPQSAPKSPVSDVMKADVNNNNQQAKPVQQKPPATPVDSKKSKKEKKKLEKQQKESAKKLAKQDMQSGGAAPSAPTNGGSKGSKSGSSSGGSRSGSSNGGSKSGSSNSGGGASKSSFGSLFSRKSSSSNSMKKTFSGKMGRRG